MSARTVDVLVASPDRNFRVLARAVLRAEGRHVVATSVSADRLPAQVRLRSPRVLLLDGSPADAELRRCVAATGTRIVFVDESPTGSRPRNSKGVSKWAPAAVLAAAVAETPAANGGPGERSRSRLRLVEP